MDPSKVNQDSALMNPEIRQQFQQLDEARKQLMNKRAEMEQEIKEHDLVLGAFGKVEESRKCYRMVEENFYEEHFRNQDRPNRQQNLSSKFQNR